MQVRRAHERSGWRRRSGNADLRPVLPVGAGTAARRAAIGELTGARTARPRTPRLCAVILALSAPWVTAALRLSSVSGEAVPTGGRRSRAWLRFCSISIAPLAPLREAVPTGGRRSRACASLRLVARAPRRAPSRNCTFMRGGVCGRTRSWAFLPVGASALPPLRPRAASSLGRRVWVEGINSFWGGAVSPSRSNLRTERQKPRGPRPERAADGA